jgi:hypothetical protein
MKICIQLYGYVRYAMYRFHSGSRLAPKKIIYFWRCLLKMDNFAIPLPVSSHIVSYARAVSYIKLDIGINSMISCKSLSEVMSFKSQSFISTQWQNQIMQFWLFMIDALRRNDHSIYVKSIKFHAVLELKTKDRTPLLLNHEYFHRL